MSATASTRRRGTCSPRSSAPSGTTRCAWRGPILPHPEPGLDLRAGGRSTSRPSSPRAKAYVALSRLRSPEGLISSSELDRGHQIAVPSRLLAYEETAASDSQLADCLSSAQRDYWQEQTLSAFRWAGCAQRFRTHAFSYHIESERSAQEQLRGLGGRGERHHPRSSTRSPSASSCSCSGSGRAGRGTGGVALRIEGGCGLLRPPLA